MPKSRRAPARGPKSETAPHYGAPGEKRAREKTEGDHHHGGRTETPDADVNPAKALHVDENANSPAKRRRPAD